MTALSPAKAGDKGDVRIVELHSRVNQATTPYNLSQAASVRALVRCARQPVGILTASVVDADDGIIEVNLGTATTDWLPARPTPGTWSIEYEVTFNDGTVLTWPNDGYDTIEVKSDVA